MSRNHYRPTFAGNQDHVEFNHFPSREYGLGLSDVVYAEQIADVKRRCRSGQIGSFATIEEWIDWNVHPAWQDEALGIAASYQQQQP